MQNWIENWVENWVGNWIENWVEKLGRKIGSKIGRPLRPIFGFLNGGSGRGGWAHGAARPSPPQHRGELVRSRIWAAVADHRVGPSAHPKSSAAHLIFADTLRGQHTKKRKNEMPPPPPRSGRRNIFFGTPLLFMCGFADWRLQFHHGAHCESWYSSVI